VLIAEDNFPNQKVAVLLLKKLGVRMDLAENGSVALEHLMARPYDLVLMDCHMPEMNGYQAAAEVRRREGPNRHVPIVAVTADVASGSRERALESGMNDFIGKPIHVSELERVLRTWIRPERQWGDLEDDGSARSDNTGHRATVSGKPGLTPVRYLAQAQRVGPIRATRCHLAPRGRAVRSATMARSSCLTPSSWMTAPRP
jgi:CheY-like chemotaxis protein